MERWRKGAAVLLMVVGMASAARAATAVGDWGHYLRYAPKVFLNNPDGRAFTVTLNLFRWPVESWNRQEVTLKFTAPDGEAIVDGTVRVDGDQRVFEVPAGRKGVYVFEMNLPVRHPVGGPDFWIESTLDQSVVWTGPGKGHAVVDRWLLVQCSVPRRYWFWVPPGTRSFTCRSQWVHMYQSQREDWGITIFSPRGQRVRTLWGDLDYDRGRPFTNDESRTMSVPVNVEPGADGRFWSVELRFADSHNYTKVSFSLDGVPPYLARSPEEWFDPGTGKKPEVPLYDDDPFMQFAKLKDNDVWPWLMNFSPCPSLGDPDGTEVRGDASFFLWNPEDRPLNLRVGTYLPRGMNTNAEVAHVRVTGAKGKVVEEKDVSMVHLHGESGAPVPLAATGKGVAKVEVSGVERWLAFTYPATSLVLAGQPVDGGGFRYSLECGSARNWYYYVPRGVRRFGVKIAAEHASDVMDVEINSPDRTLARIYGREGETTIEVPAGLDGKIWHLRLDVGSASTMRNDPGRPYRFLHHYLTIELNGVPGFLSPTWEQWFDPAKPVVPTERW